MPTRPRTRRITFTDDEISALLDAVGFYILGAQAMDPSYDDDDPIEAGLNAAHRLDVRRAVDKLERAQDSIEAV